MVVHSRRDLALARLKKPVTTVAPVAIASSAPSAGDGLTLAGFGRTENAWIINRLKSAAFTVDAVAAARLTVTSTGSGNICRGDAGGPALRKSGGTYELFGLHLTSNQAGCLGEAAGEPRATETRVDDVRDWVTANLPGFTTGFEAVDARANWLSAADTGTNGHGSLPGVAGIISTADGPELDARAERAHTGTTALMYSGKDTSATRSYAYLKAFVPGSVFVRPGTRLTYRIFPQSMTANKNVSGSNSTCVAVDLIVLDQQTDTQANLRDTVSAVDQRGVRAHPLYQCGRLILDTWNEVTVDLGSAFNGKQVTLIDVGYDQSANTGGCRGYIDDLRTTDAGVPVS